MRNKGKPSGKIVKNPNGKPVPNPRSVECPVGGYNPDWTSGRD